MCGQHLSCNEKIFHENQTPLFQPDFIKCQTTSFNKTLTANNSKEIKVTQLIQGVNQNLNEATYRMRILTTYLNLKEQWEVVRKASDYAASVKQHRQDPQLEGKRAAAAHRRGPDLVQLADLRRCDPAQLAARAAPPSRSKRRHHRTRKKELQTRD